MPDHSDQEFDWDRPGVYSDDVVRVLDLFADSSGSGAQGGDAPYSAPDSGECGQFPPPINIALAAPIGADGPLVFDLGDMRTLLFNSVIIQSGMRISSALAKIAGR